MKFQRTLKEEVSVNMTPLIDVVFLLLIFFMVTTTFTRDSNLLINLPEASSESSSDTPIQIELLISRAGEYSLNGQALANGEINTLISAIEALSAGDNSLPITITADAETTHQSVITAMDAVTQLGFTRLSLATRQTGSN